VIAPSEARRRRHGGEGDRSSFAYHEHRIDAKLSGPDHPRGEWWCDASWMYLDTRAEVVKRYGEVGWQVAEVDGYLVFSEKVPLEAR